MTITYFGNMNKEGGVSHSAKKGKKREKKGGRVC